MTADATPLTDRPTARVKSRDPLDLTNQSPWRWRVIHDDGRAGPWGQSLADAVGPVAVPPRRLQWPTCWRVWDLGLPPRQSLMQRPEATQKPLEVCLDAEQVLDLDRLLGSTEQGRTAWVEATLSLPQPQQLTLHVAADYFLQLFIDANECFNTLQQGNRRPIRCDAYTIDLELDAGDHLVTGQVGSGRGGWALAIEATLDPDPAIEPTGWRLEAARVFDVEQLDDCVSLTIESDDPRRLRLNDRPPPNPDDGMRRRRLMGLPCDWLRPGLNTLSCRWSQSESADGVAVEPLRLFDASQGRRRLVPDGRTLAIPSAAVDFDIPPIISSDRPDRLTLTCRTNAATAVTLDVGGRRLQSPSGLVHRLSIERLPPGQPIGYRVAAADAILQRRTAPLPSGPCLRLAVCADAGPLPEVWRAVASAIADAQPDAVVFVGDLVNHGLHDEQWVAFARDAADLLGTIPFFAVPGNHDHDAPLFHQVFAPPGAAANPGRHWCQRIADATLLGIDGAEDFTSGSASHNWLEQQLRETHDSDYLLVFNHYPAWSSGPHAAVDAHGRLREQSCRAAREHIVPLLERYGATLYCCGHDHMYERSVLPSGLVHVVCGGAGGYLYAPTSNSDRNPHAHCLHSVHHYCLVSITEKTCRFEGISVDGRCIDRFEIRPRTATGGTS